MGILVTGGLGAVGTPLTQELRRRGHKVWVSDRAHHHHPQYARCDVSEFHQVEALFTQHGPFDYVYHLGAEFGRKNGEDFYATLWKSNAIGTKNIIRMQERLGFRLIFTSSSEIYGDYDGVMIEDVPDRVPIRQLNDYAMTKWVSEMQILNSTRDFGTETVRVRLFNTYGPGEHYSEYRSAVCIFVYRALSGIPYAVYTRHLRTLSYVDDTVRTLANIVDRFHPGSVYNIAGLELYDMKQVSDLVLRLTGKTDQLVTYEELEPATTAVKKVDASRATRELGHHASVDLEEGLRRTIAWQRDVYGFE